MTFYINDSNGLRELPEHTRFAIGAWFHSGPGQWSQLRMPNHFANRFGSLEWVNVPVEQLPKQMRVHMLLVGVS